MPEEKQESGTSQIPSKPFVPGSGENAVLIDNSTYHSFHVAIIEKRLDASVLYNMANFLECLVLAENVRLAPTIVNSECLSELFTGDGPCRRIELDDETFNATFYNALEWSISDIDNKSVRQTIPIDQSHDKKAKELLEYWRSSRLPAAEYREVYSGAVFITDSASGDLLAGLRTVTNPHSSAHEHLAHYLLRTNFSLKMSEMLPYQPHSHRIRFVCAKLRNAVSATELLLRQAELQIAEAEREDSLAPLRKAISGGRQELPEMPLVLGAVLNSTEEKNPGGLVQAALQIRNLSEAKRFRTWVGKLNSAIWNGNWGAREDALHELAEASEALTQEIAAAYDKRRGEICKVSTAVVDTISDVKPSNDWLNTLLDMLKHGPHALSTARKAWKKHQLRKRIAVFTSLHKKGPTNFDRPLASFLDKRFGPDEAPTFSALIARQSERVANVRKIRKPEED